MRLRMSAIGQRGAENDGRLKTLPGTTGADDPNVDTVRSAPCGAKASWVLRRHHRSRRLSVGDSDLGGFVRPLTVVVRFGAGRCSEPPHATAPYCCHRRHEHALTRRRRRGRDPVQQAPPLNGVGCRGDPARSRPPGRRATVGPADRSNVEPWKREALRLPHGNIWGLLPLLRERWTQTSFTHGEHLYRAGSADRGSARLPSCMGNTGMTRGFRVVGK